jgi:hypothetical protein
LFGSSIVEVDVNYSGYTDAKTIHKQLLHELAALWKRVAELEKPKLHLSNKEATK